jgi:hypothetical protein
VRPDGGLAIAVDRAPSNPLPQEALCVTDVPSAFAVEPRNGNAYLSWSAVSSAEAYEVEIYRLDSGAGVATQTLRETRWEWGGPELGQGPYEPA